MSIIQTIRDKAAWIITIAIGVALIAFVVQDSFRSSSMSGNSTTLATINGTDVDAIEFEQRVQQAENQYRAAGYPMNDMMRENIRESLWNEYLEDGIFSERYEDLGITVSDKELSDIIYGENPPQDLRQQFTDPNTGLYDANAAYQQIEQLRKQKNNPMYQSFFNQYLPALRKTRQKEKYISLISTSNYVPRWMVERMNVDNSQQANISLVSIPYATISDSAVAVTDGEINEYVKSRGEEYKQDKSRSIDYVMFDASPSASDSADQYSQLEALKAGFSESDDPAVFLMTNTTEIPYFDGYVQNSKLQVPFPDSIRNLSDGQIFGPYIDGGNYTLAKMVGRRTIPDSVKVRHILIKTGEQGRLILDDSTAKSRIDSIANAVRSGSNFDTLVARLSDDMGSKETGGVYDFSSMQFASISKEFAEVAFYGKTGDKKVVKTENNMYSGYHYIEVLNQKNFEMAYNVAYLSRPIVASDATINNAMGLASQFAAESRDKKAFDENVRKKNLQKFTASDIKPLEANLAGLGSSREIVKWMYDSKVGTVAERPYLVGDQYVVPVLTAVNEEGIMSAANARPLVENIIRNRKKADQIKQKLKSATSLEAAAQATGQQVIKADSIQFSNPFIPNVGQEAKVVGAAFNKDYQAKISEPIPGNGGVFVIKTEAVSAIPNPNFDVIGQQAMMLQNQQRAFSDPRLVLEILKKSAKIKDNRANFF